MDAKQAAIGIVHAMLEVIEAHGAEGVPSGHLYARVMGKLNIETYSQIIMILKLSGRVYEEHNVLYAKQGRMQ